MAQLPRLLDHATKTTLANIENGASPTKAASSSTELAGPARIAPLVAFLAEGPEELVVRAAVEQTRLTHNSSETVEATEFLATATYRILQGGDLVDTIDATAPEAALQQAKEALELGTTEAISRLGQSCATEKALPSILYLALKFGDDLPKAFSENAMAGGDNCARGLALGMLLGAASGADAIPVGWRDGLRADAVRPFLDALSA